MARTGTLLAALLAALFCTVFAGTAEACEGHEAAKAESATKPVKSEKAKAETGKSVLHDIDTLVADKCSCGGASDCTCKAGKCNCGKCGGKKAGKAAKKVQLTEPLKGQTDALVLPKEARNDATGGAFI